MTRSKKIPTRKLSRELAGYCTYHGFFGPRMFAAEQPAAPEVVPAPAAPEFKPGDRVIYRAFNPVAQIASEFPGVVVNVNGHVLVKLDYGGHAWVNPKNITLESKND